MAMTLIAKGAEADILLDENWNGKKVIIKRRVEKKYRHPLIDQEVRRTRTIHEANIIYRAKEAGVPTPSIYQVDIGTSTIVMESVEGEKVRDIVKKLSDKENCTLFKLIGRESALLHRAGLIHGDLTTSNMIKVGNRVVFIDFGLGEISTEIEKRGVDLNLMMRMLSSTHFETMDILVKSFKEGYRETMGENADEIFQRVDEIRKRGRYIEKE